MKELGLQDGELELPKGFGRIWDPLICLHQHRFMLLRIDPFVPSMHHLKICMLIHKVKRPLKRRPRVTFSPTSMSLQHSMAFPQYFLLVVLSWIYVYFRFLRKKSTIPLPPGPPADPLLGHLRCLMHATNTTFFEWHRQYGIPYFSLPSHTVR